MVFRVFLLAVFAVASFGSVAALGEVRAPDGAASYRAAHCRSVREALSMPTALFCECDGKVISDISCKEGCKFGDPKMLLAYFWIASVLWAHNVTTKIVAATVAGSVATWWSSPDTRQVRVGAVPPGGALFTRVSMGYAAGRLPLGVT